MRPVRRNRRGFLRDCGWLAGSLFIPAGFPAQEHPFHVKPTYREKTAIDSAVLKIKAGSDSFHSEQVYQRLAPILNDLLERPPLSEKFVGASWRPLETRPLREQLYGLRVEQLQFPQQASLKAQEFLAEMKVAFSPFSKILTAELQITKVEGSSTRIRYEIVGTGDGFYREQRVGYWLLDWEGDRITHWRMAQETRSRSQTRFFADVTRPAFSGDELSHGADYWRTVLDGASGIDIYGHNGISVGDFDGDGHDGLYVCQAAGLPNRLYRNRGDGSFEDVTDAAGVGVLENTACALFADFSNHGRQDLLVVRANGPLLFVNQGNGRFSLKRDAFQFAHPPQGTFTGASAADYNRDGFLDVYFCLYTYYQGADQYKYPSPYFAAENGPPNFLMRNTGGGTFQDVTAQCGLDTNNTRYSFCCGWSDYNRDGLPDLYVVNDFGRKNLYRNNGDGTFTDVATQMGVEDVGAGMSVGWSDFDNNGKPDLYVANMWTAAGERVTSEKGFQQTAPESVRDLYRKHSMGNSLLRNDGSAFVDATAKSGTGIGRWAWSSDAWDFDHDGFEDIYVTNGMISSPLKEDLNGFFWREVVAKSPNTFKPDAEYEAGWNAINELVRSDYSWSGAERNVLFANHGDGTFSDVSGAAGLDFIEDGRAFALADIDGDGRQEVFIKNRNSPQLRLIKNVIQGLAPAIAFRLRGTNSNWDAIGASVTVGHQTKVLQAGSGFLSQHSKELFFGLGRATGAMSATIRWPSGLVQELKGLAANSRVSVTEGGTYRAEAFKEGAAAQESVQEGETLPETVETWLLSPILAPGVASGKATAVSFETANDQKQELCAVYNLLFRQMFDRHRDMPLPTSFLVNERREIVKVYQGPVSAETLKHDMANMPRTAAERLQKALPFRGRSDTYEYSRNYLSLGSVFFQRGYIEYSEDFFDAALKQDASSAEAFYGLGSVYLRQGKNELAQRNFEHAVKFPASYPETAPNAWNNLGLLATRKGDAAQAVDYFQQALRVDPDNFIALENLGNAYKQQKRWAEAKAALTRALAMKPSDAEANYSLGMVFAQLNDADSAAEYLNQALKVRPAYPEALNNLAILYLRTRRRDEAVAMFQRCIEVAPAFDQAYLNLARVYAIEGAPEKARTVLTALLKQHPDSAAAKQALAQLP